MFPLQIIFKSSQYDAVVVCFASSIHDCSSCSTASITGAVYSLKREHRTIVLVHLKGRERHSVGTAAHLTVLGVVSSQQNQTFPPESAPKERKTVATIIS